MWFGIPLFPDEASTLAWRVDLLYFFLLALTAFFALLIAGLIVFCMIKYRRQTPLSVGTVPFKGVLSYALEAGWTIIPLLITLVIFVWGTSVFFAMASPPSDAI